MENLSIVLHYTRGSRWLSMIYIVKLAFTRELIGAEKGVCENSAKIFAAEEATARRVGSADLCRSINLGYFAIERVCVYSHNRQGERTFLPSSLARSRSVREESKKKKNIRLRETRPRSKSEPREIRSARLTAACQIARSRDRR